MLSPSQSGRVSLSIACRFVLKILSIYACLFTYLSNYLFIYVAS